MVYIIRPVDGSDIIIYVCTKCSPEKMIDELENFQLEYILSDDSVTAKKNDPFLLSLIHEN